MTWRGDGVKNAIISSASLSIADHGILSGWIHLDYGGQGQGFGGHGLHVIGAMGEANYAGWWITRVLEIAGVTSWDQLKGKTLRVSIRDGLIQGIGHIVNDEWFFPKPDFDAMSAARSKVPA